MTASPPPVWVVGAGGLLGTAVVRRLVRLRRDALASDIPWDRTDRAVGALVAGFDELVERADGGPWQVAWCAGTGVTSSATGVFDAEIATLSRWVDTVRTRHRDALGNGAVFLASSAGGVYAGATPPPFTEATPPAPLSPYGVAKLRAEATVAALADDGARVLVGRISNLYGPGQDLRKAQGLVSQICRAQLLAQPVGVYVSLDTVRDYLFVDDAAAMVVEGLDLLTGGPPTRVVTKILASQRSATIAEVVGEVRLAFRRRPILRFAASPASRAQARDLRFRSTVLPELDRRTFTPFPVGIRATIADLALRIQAGELVRAR